MVFNTGGPVKIRVYLQINMLNIEDTGLLGHPGKLWVLGLEDQNGLERCSSTMAVF